MDGYFFIALAILLIFGFVSFLIGKRLNKEINNEIGKNMDGPRNRVITVNVHTEYTLQKEDIRPSEPLMTEQQFHNLKTNVSSLLDILDELKDNSRLFDMINEKSTSTGGLAIEDMNYLFKILKVIFIKDLEHCYIKLGLTFRISTYTPEGQSLLLIADTLNGRRNTFIDYPEFRGCLETSDISELSAITMHFGELKSIRVNTAIEGDEEFAISAMLINLGSSEKYLTAYRELLHNIILCINEISQNTQIKGDEWLKEMEDKKWL